ncbi:MAG: putative metal-binding motif-containing protein [Deltaproteobacteria bacterium]|nr:putative metal-binding motif-containing protein [Deltaproteobacteria bacterium]
MTFYADADADGYGTTSSQCLCEAEGTYTASNNDDCNDANKTANPAGVEVRDTVDNNCDDYCDEGLLSYGDLVITEIMQDPKTLRTARPSGLSCTTRAAPTFRCAGLVILRWGSDNHNVSGEVFIAAGEHALFLRDDDTGKNGGLTGGYSYGSDVTLDNYDDDLYIEFDGVIIDEMAYDYSREDWSAAMARASRCSSTPTSTAPLTTTTR